MKPKRFLICLGYILIVFPTVAILQFNLTPEQLLFMWAIAFLGTSIHVSTLIP